MSVPEAYCGAPDIAVDYGGLGTQIGCVPNPPTPDHWSHWMKLSYGGPAEIDERIRLNVEGAVAAERRWSEQSLTR